MLVKNAENYINRLKKMIIARFGNIETAITHDDDCDMHAVQISFLLNGKYSWVCAYDDDDVITYYVSGKGHTKEMTIEDTQVKSMYRVLARVERLAYETDIEATETSEAEESSEIKEATEDYNEYEEILDSEESTEHDRIKYLMDTHSLVPHVTINSHCMETVLYMEELLTQRYGNTIAHKCKMYNNGYYGCPADRQGNRCCGEKWCAETWKRYEAIIKPEWHHVSLNTLANLDFDILDEKRQLYLKLYRELKELIQDLHKCKSGRAYERRLAKMYIRNAELFDENKISYDYINYVTRKISMCNVECGLWTSLVEEATGLHKSRRYNMHTLRY
jgi:hypothetical protein